MESKYVCPCGLLCSDCLFFKEEIYENAVKLRDSIKDSQLDIFLGSIVKSKGYNFIADHLTAERSAFGKTFEPFNKLPEFLEVLEALIQLRCNTTCRETGGCSMGGATHQCEAVKCVQAKGLDGCWDCPEHETCEKLNFVKKIIVIPLQKTLIAYKEMASLGCAPGGKSIIRGREKRKDNPMTSCST